jgi:hypothetical protein
MLWKNWFRSLLVYLTTLYQRLRLYIVKGHVWEGKKQRKGKVKREEAKNKEGKRDLSTERK